MPRCGLLCTATQSSIGSGGAFTALPLSLCPILLPLLPTDVATLDTPPIKNPTKLGVVAQLVIPVLGRLRQEDYKFVASLSYLGPLQLSEILFQNKE